MADEERQKLFLDMKDRHKALLDIDYNKLLSYLAGVLVFLFMLVQVSIEIKDQNIPWYVVFLISGASLVGVIFFIMASYHNYKEIIKLENRLGISEILEPSRIFSQRINENTKDRKISICLKILLGGLVGFAVLLVLVNLYLAGFRVSIGIIK